MPQPTCRCAEASEIRGSEAVDYLDHLDYVTEEPSGWLFRCPDLSIEWIAPYSPKDAPPETFELRRQLCP